MQHVWNRGCLLCVGEGGGGRGGVGLFYLRSIYSFPFFLFLFLFLSDGLITDGSSQRAFKSKTTNLLDPTRLVPCATSASHDSLQ